MASVSCFQHIPGDFDSYIQDMAKPKTYGTMTELRAMCCLYRYVTVTSYGM